MKFYKFRKKEGRNIRIKVRSLLKWDGITPELDEVIFTDNFHLIATFKDGTVKDIDAYVFINHKEFYNSFDEVRDNIDLFQNPFTVTQSFIQWTDIADISAKGLWKWGTTLAKTYSPNIKTLKNGTPNDSSLKNFLKQYAKEANYRRLHRYLSEDCVCFITAFMPWNNLEDTQKNLALCRQETEKLERAIRIKLNYSYIKIKSHYTYTANDEDFHFCEENFMVICNSFNEAIKEKNESILLETSEIFKTKMIKLMDEFNQDSILLQHYKGNGKFITGIRYSEEAQKHGKKDHDLSSQMTKEEIKHLWSKSHYEPFKNDADRAQAKLIFIEYDFTYEKWHYIHTWTRGYNWERYLKNRRKQEEHDKNKEKK